ncbi:MAG: acyltransferase [Eubacteriales bacterium]
MTVLIKARIGELDTFRGLAFAAVVLQHTIGIYNQRGGFTTIDKWLAAGLFSAAKFAVPAFVFVTGLVLFYNYYDSLNYHGFIVKRFTEVGIPYLAWSLYYTSFYTRRWPVTPDYFKVYVKNILSGKGGYHLWFIVLIMQFYILFPVWRYLFQLAGRLLRSSASKWAVLAAAGFFYLWLVVWAYSTQFSTQNPVLLSILKYRDHISLLWYLYFMIGGVAGLNLKKFRSLLKPLTKPALLTYVVIFYYFTHLMAGGDSRISLKYAGSFTPAMAIFSVATILLFYRLAITLSDKVHFFDTLGRYSLGAYLAHAAVLNWTTLAVIYLTPGAGITLHLLLTFILTVLISLVLTMLLNRLPLGNFLTGRVRTKTG